MASSYLSIAGFLFFFPSGHLETDISISVCFLRIKQDTLVTNPGSEGQLWLHSTNLFSEKGALCLENEKTCMAFETELQQKSWLFTFLT